MRAWLHTLDVSNVWRSSELSDEAKRAPLAGLVQGLADRLGDAELGYIAEALGDAANTAEFNAAWSEFYDWADAHRVWVDTWGFSRKQANS